MKVKTKIIGSKVHDIGYRVFLLRKALELGMERFNAYNTKENGVQVVISFTEGDRDQISASDYMHLIQVEQLSMLEKLDQTRTEISSEIRELRWDLRSHLDEKLIKIESDIFKIKEKIGLKA